MNVYSLKSWIKIAIKRHRAIKNVIIRIIFSFRRKKKEPKNIQNKLIQFTTTYQPETPADGVKFWRRKMNTNFFWKTETSPTPKEGGTPGGRYPWLYGRGKDWRRIMLFHISPDKGYNRILNVFFMFYRPPTSY